MGNSMSLGSDSVTSSLVGSSPVLTHIVLLEQGFLGTLISASLSKPVSPHPFFFLYLPLDLILMKVKMVQFGLRIVEGGNQNLETELHLNSPPKVKVSSNRG